VNVRFITKANGDVISHGIIGHHEENATLDFTFYFNGDNKYCSRACLNIIQRVL